MTNNIMRNSSGNFTPFAPTMLFKGNLTNHNARQQAIDADRVRRRIGRRQVVVGAEDRLIAGVEVVQVLADHGLQRHGVLARRRHSPPGGIAIGARTLRRRKHVAHALHHVVNGPQALTSVVRGADRRRHLVVPVVVSVSAEYFAAGPHSRLGQVAIGHVPVHDQDAQTVAGHRPFQGRAAQGVGGVGLLPCLRRHKATHGRARRRATQLVVPDTVVSQA